MNNNLTIAYSTREIDLNYHEHVKATCGLNNVEILAYQNNGQQSLTEIYNQVLDKAKNDLIVFCHDDLIFETNNWGIKIINHFKKNPRFGIIGLAGTNQLINGMWWSVNESMHGIVNHTDGVKKWTSNFSQDQGDEIKDMIVLDGLFFAVNRKKIIHRFDEDFKGFHFYDLSFCFPNYLDGVDLGVITNIRVTHMSIGETNDMWEENKILFEKKYGDELPISTDEFEVVNKPEPKVHMHVLCWNEEKIIPHFLKHYENHVSKIFVYDNMSTDNSVRLLNQNKKVKVIPYDTNGEIRDDEYLKIKNNAWKESKNADIVIICDMDEFLYTEDIKSYLTNFNNSKSTIVKPIGYEMMIRDFDITKSEYVLDDVKYGYEHTHFNKLVMFKPKEIKEINYNFGCHFASPVGNVVYHNKPIKLLHLKKMGLDYFLNKMKTYHERVSKFNRDNKLGYEYDFTPEKHTENFLSELEKIKKVI